MVRTHKIPRTHRTHKENRMSQVIRRLVVSLLVCSCACAGVWGADYATISKVPAETLDWSDSASWENAKKPTTKKTNDAGTSYQSINQDSIITLNSDITCSEMLILGTWDATNTYSVTIKLNGYNLHVDSTFHQNNITNALKIEGPGTFSMKGYDLYGDDKDHFMYLTKGAVVDIQDTMYSNGTPVTIKEGPDASDQTGDCTLYLPAGGQNINWGPSELKAASMTAIPSANTDPAKQVYTFKVVKTTGKTGFDYTITISNNGTGNKQLTDKKYTVEIIKKTSESISYQIGDDSTEYSDDSKDFTYSLDGSKSSSTDIRVHSSTTLNVDEGFKITVMTPDGTMPLGVFEYIEQKWTWSGADSSDGTDWTKHDNWIYNGSDSDRGNDYPPSTANITISSGCSSYPEIKSGQTVSIHNVTIMPGARISQSGGTFKVDQLYIEGSGAYQATGGEVQFTSASPVWNCEYPVNSKLPDVKISNGTTFVLTSDMYITGSLTVESGGVFNAQTNSKTLFVQPSGTSTLSGTTTSIKLGKLAVSTTTSGKTLNISGSVATNEISVNGTVNALITVAGESGSSIQLGNDCATGNYIMFASNSVPKITGGKQYTVENSIPYMGGHAPPGWNYTAPATAEWNGSQDENWSTAGNWTPAQIPQGTIKIPKGCQKYPKLSTVIKIKTAIIQIEEGASLDLDGNTLEAFSVTNSGSLTVGTGILSVSDLTLKNGSDVSISTGTIQASSTLTNQGKLSLESGTIKTNNLINDSDGTMTVTSGVGLSLSVFTNRGTLKLPNGVTVPGTKVNGDSSLVEYTDNDPDLSWGAKYNDVKIDGTLSVANGSSWTISEADAVTFIKAVTNAGTISTGTAKCTFKESFSGTGSLSSAAGGEMTFVKGFSNTGTINLAGKTTFSGGAAQTVQVGASANFADVTVSGAGGISLQSDCTFTELTVSNGDIAVNGNTLTVSGNWNHGGGAITTTGSGKVICNGTATFSTSTSISGSNSWNNLTCETDGTTLTFAGGSTQTVNGVLTLTGGSTSGNEINLCSKTAGTKWILEMGTVDADHLKLTNVSVTDSEADPVITSIIDVAGTTVKEGTAESTIGWFKVITKYTWDNGSGDGSWATAGNWLKGAVRAPSAPSATNTELEIIVNADMTLPQDIEVNKFTVNKENTVTLGTRKITATTVSVAGTLSTDGSTAGQWPTSTTWGSDGTGTVEYTGTNGVAFTDDVTFQNLTCSAAKTFTITGGKTLTVNGNLKLTGVTLTSSNTTNWNFVMGLTPTTTNLQLSNVKVSYSTATTPDTANNPVSIITDADGSTVTEGTYGTTTGWFGTEYTYVGGAGTGWKRGSRTGVAAPQANDTRLSVIIDADYSLSSNVNYKAFTLNAAKTLTAAGYKIEATTVTINGTFVTNGTTQTQLPAGTSWGTGSVIIYTGTAATAHDYVTGADTIKVDKSSGTFTFDSGLSVPAGKNVNLASGDVTVNGDLSIVATGSLKTGSGSVTISGSVTNSGNLTLGSGTVTVSGNWTNSGTFTAGTGSTVTFAPSAANKTATITGSNTWNNLTCTTAGATLKFGAGSTQTVNEVLTLTGGSTSGNEITLTSTSTTNWTLAMKGSDGTDHNTATYVKIEYVKVGYSTAEPAIATLIGISGISGTGAGTNYAVELDSAAGSTTGWFLTAPTVFTWIGTTDSSWNTLANWQSGGATPLILPDKNKTSSDIEIIIGTTGTHNLALDSDIKVKKFTVNATKTVTLGTYKVEAATVSISGTVQVSASTRNQVVQTTGNPDWKSGSVIEYTGAATSDATTGADKLDIKTTGFTINAATITASNITATSAITIANDVTIPQNLSLNADATVKGNWTNSGTFTAGTNTTVTFAPSAANKTATISGSNTWNNLTCATAGATLQFGAGDTQTVNGILTLTGSSGNEITLCSTTNGTKWILKMGTVDAAHLQLSYVTVSDSTASPAICTVVDIAGSTVTEGPGGNTAGWFYVIVPGTTFSVSYAYAVYGEKDLYVAFDEQIDSATLSAVSGALNLSGNAIKTSTQAKIVQDSGSGTVVLLALTDAVTISHIQNSLLTATGNNGDVKSKDGSKYLDPTIAVDLTPLVVNLITPLLASEDTEAGPHTIRLFDGSGTAANTLTAGSEAVLQTKAAESIKYQLMITQNTGWQNQSGADSLCTWLATEAASLPSAQIISATSTSGNNAVFDIPANLGLNKALPVFLFFGLTDAGGTALKNGSGRQLMAVWTTESLWTYRLSDVTRQEGGVTIRNNVINVLSGEETVIEVEMKSRGSLSVQILTLDGNVVVTLQKGTLAAGTHDFRWNGTNKNGAAVARGMYFVRIKGNGIDQTRKVMVVRE